MATTWRRSPIGARPARCRRRIWRSSYERWPRPTCEPIWPSPRWMPWFRPSSTARRSSRRRPRSGPRWKRYPIWRATLRIRESRRSPTRWGRPSWRPSGRRLVPSRLRADGWCCGWIPTSHPTPRPTISSRDRSRARSCSSGSRIFYNPGRISSAWKRRSRTSARRKKRSSALGLLHRLGRRLFLRGRLFAIDLVRDLALRLTELPDGLTESARHLGNLARPEDQQDDEEEQSDFLTTESEHYRLLWLLDP